MPIMPLTKDNFETIMMSHELTLVDFWAPWCAPCRDFDEIYSRVQEKFPGVIFGRVDIQKERELAETFEVRSIPMLLIFRKNIVVYRDSGVLGEAALIDIIEQAQLLDRTALEGTPPAK
jgi:thioredoxin